jgi:hypothetical protein
MLDALSRGLALGVLVAHVTSAATPCPPVAPASIARAPHASGHAARETRRMDASHVVDHAAHRRVPAADRSAHGHGPSNHASASPVEPPAGADLTAPCPCGCQEHAGQATSRSRVGVALPRAALARIGFVPPPPAGFVLARAPVAPILTDDPVPISS